MDDDDDTKPTPAPPAAAPGPFDASKYPLADEAFARRVEASLPRGWQDR